MAGDRLIVALDVDTKEEALRLAGLLNPYVGFFKIGMQLFYSAGPEVVRAVSASGAQVFVDLKLHDIPNTVAHACRALVRLGAAMINVHASGGYGMMAAAFQAVQEESVKRGVRRPLLVAVTVLTSIDREVLNSEIGIKGEIVEKVVGWSELARLAGLDGVVASPLEVCKIRRALGKDFVIVTPGVRPVLTSTDDQKRLATPMEAVKNGSNYVVVGRPVISAPDPVRAARNILDEIEAAIE